ncbi:uncharacterized protein LOC129764386 [Toxorhynchites rutilus septentrionalis]|uniref:uncharacterized protein LOC129764386 n=1 Tax=Toxorhynchites rutilus septentrionalis TaxID=329112 RepID=UPI00247B2B1D|nr:uncharacterized protein LOC129764386 [Toxorhynchites rutilus septentrionalis]
MVTAATKAIALVLLYFCWLQPQSDCKEYNFDFDPRELECPGNVTHERVMLTAYRPQFDSDTKRDFTDIKLKKLYTLQDFLDNRAPYVTVGMDPKLRVPYGKPVCVPELNLHFRRNIKLQVRDTHEDLADGGFRRVDICVRTQADSFDDVVNLLDATLVF